MEDSVLPQQMQKAVDSWKFHNSSFEYEFHDKHQRKQFILENFDVNTLSAFEKLGHGAAKADFWRYCILYEFGGFYSDIDQLCLQPILDWLQPDDEIVVPIMPHMHHLVANSFIGIIPKHPLMREVLDKMIMNIHNQTYSHIGDLCGPAHFSQCIKNLYNVTASNNNFRVGHHVTKKMTHTTGSSWKFTFRLGISKSKRLV